MQRFNSNKSPIDDDEGDIVGNEMPVGQMAPFSKPYDGVLPLDEEDDSGPSKQVAARSTPDMNSAPTRDPSGIKTRLDYRNRGMEVPNDSNPQNFRSPVAQGGDALGMIKQVLAYGYKKFGLQGGGTAQYDDGGPVDDPANDPLIPQQEALTGAPDLKETQEPFGQDVSYANQNVNDGPGGVLGRVAGDIQRGQGALRTDSGGMASGWDRAVKGVSDVMGPPPAAPKDNGLEVSGLLGAGAKWITAMVGGSGAAPSQTVEQAKAQVDPQRQMTDADRNVAATTSQKTEDDKLKFVQHFRQKYTIAQGMVVAAIEGTDQKAPDLKAAAANANQMFSYLLDGQNVDVVAQPKGFTVTVTAQGSNDPRTFQLTPQQMMTLVKGPDGLYDSMIQNGGATEVLSKLGGGKTTAVPATAKTEQTKTGVTPEPGSPQALYQNSDDIDQAKMRQARSAYPMASQSVEMQKYYQELVKEEQERGNKLDVANRKAEATETAATTRAESSNRNTDVRAAGNARRYDQLDAREKAKLGQQLEIETAKMANNANIARGRDKAGILRALVTGAMPEDAAAMDKLMGPAWRDAAKEIIGQLQAAAPAPPKVNQAAPNQPGAAPAAQGNRPPEREGFTVVQNKSGQWAYQRKMPQ